MSLNNMSSSVCDDAMVLTCRMASTPASDRNRSVISLGSSSNASRICLAGPFAAAHVTKLPFPQTPPRAYPVRYLLVTPFVVSGNQSVYSKLCPFAQIYSTLNKTTHMHSKLHSIRYTKNRYM